MLHKTQTILLLTVIMALAACGPAAAPQQAPATSEPTAAPQQAPATSEPVSANPDAVAVQVKLTEFAVQSSVTDFKVGVPYTFTIENAGNATHEWLIMPRGESDRAKALVSVGSDQLGSGAKATVEYIFTKAGEFEMACHIGRHYENGMVIPITVSG